HIDDDASVRRIRQRSTTRLQHAVLYRVCHRRPLGLPRVTGGVAAAWRSCAIPENSAASVDAVWGSASMTSPPLAVRWTVSPETRRWISAADGNGSAPGAAAPGASRDSSP